MSIDEYSFSAVVGTRSIAVPNDQSMVGPDVDDAFGSRSAPGSWQTLRGNFRYGEITLDYAI